MTVRDVSRSDRRPERRLARSCVLGASLLALIACTRSAPQPSSRPGSNPGDRPSSRSVAVVVSGDTAGWIMPCGCTTNQSGGLSRRGTFVGRARADHAVILADAGGAPGGTSPYQRLKFEAILAGERAMGIDAHNLGAPEADLGAEYLREVRERMEIPFISANLRDARGALIAAPLREVEATPGGLRVTLVGVVSPRLVRGGLKADEPRDAILKAIGGDRPRDALVVLAYLPEAELRQLAAELPEADIVVGGPTGQSIAPTRIGPTWLASATNKGKFLIQMATDGRGTPWSGQVVDLSPSIPDDPAQERNLGAFHAELARRDFPAEQTGLVPRWPPDLPTGYHVAGTQSCRACHRDDCKLWDESRHAHAWRRLQDRGLHVDPQCQSCHTTAYGLPGGFQSIANSPERTAVGCESCHGPAQAHVDRPRTRTQYAARDQCLSCHDRENSPGFGFDDYWKRIRHGAPIVKTIEKRREEHP
jgi:hypothetical protein